MTGGGVTGTRFLLRASLRFEGRSLIPWILAVAALASSSVLAYALVFPSHADRVAFSATVAKNPAIGLIFGPAFNLMTADGFGAWRGLAIGGFLAGLCAIFAVIRTTRAQEDSGQAELLSSGVMGRAAYLATGIGMGVIGSVLVGLIAAIVTVACGGGWAATPLLCATFTVTGLMFTAVAAISAQIGSDARIASSIAVTALGALFVLRGLTYALGTPGWTTWVNPLSWMTETRPASGDDWWPLLPGVALSAVLVVVAFALRRRRDFGGGAVAPRPGPVRGRERTSWRLTLRTNRGALITWTVVFIGLGFVFGFFSTSITDLLSGDPAVRRILAAGVATPDQFVGAFVVMILAIAGIVAAVPGVLIVAKVRQDEMADRVEPLLATDVSRTRYFTGNVVLAFLGPAVFLIIAGLLMGAIIVVADLGVSFGDVVLQAVATVPAVWTAVALAVAVVGRRPRATLAAWVGVILSFALTLFGPTFDLPDWMLAVSPFWHVPNIPLGESGGGLIGISLVTAALLAVGITGFRSRDIAV